MQIDVSSVNHVFLSEWCWKSRSCCFEITPEFRLEKQNQSWNKRRLKGLCCWTGSPQSGYWRGNCDQLEISLTHVSLFCSCIFSSKGIKKSSKSFAQRFFSSPLYWWVWEWHRAVQMGCDRSRIRFGVTTNPAPFLPSHLCPPPLPW